MRGTLRLMNMNTYLEFLMYFPPQTGVERLIKRIHHPPWHPPQLSIPHPHPSYGSFCSLVYVPGGLLQ